MGCVARWPRGGLAATGPPLAPLLWFHPAAFLFLFLALHHAFVCRHPEYVIPYGGPRHIMCAPARGLVVGARRQHGRPGP